MNKYGKATHTNRILLIRMKIEKINNVSLYVSRGGGDEINILFP